MEVLLARAAGFCFGVRDGLAVAAAEEDPMDVTIYGDFVHNDDVRASLAARGFRAVPERGRDAATPATTGVLITAHGVSDRTREKLLAAGKRLIDATCPIVRRAHAAACAFAAAGLHVVVIGDPDHVEVRGLVEDLPFFDVVRGPADVRPLGRDRLGVVAQTTVPPDHAAVTLAALRAAHPDAEVRWKDTICDPTKDRLAAVVELAPKVDAFVVVGGATSNNVRRLAAAAEATGRPTYRVAGPEELDPRAFVGVRAVGLTAGTSTPDAVIARVRAALAALA